MTTRELAQAQSLSDDEALAELEDLAEQDRVERQPIRGGEFWAHIVKQVS